MFRSTPRIVHLDRVRCPFCHDEIGEGEAQLACNKCRAWHHQACWDEGNHACSACGSNHTGFIDKTRRATTRLLRRQRHLEFRFPCSACDEPMWAARTDAGRRGQCPRCEQELAIPEPAEAEEEQPDENSLAMEIGVAPVLAILIGVIVGMVCGLLGGIGGLIAEALSSDAGALIWTWTKAGAVGGCLWAFALSLLLAVAVVDEDGERLPKSGRGWLFLTAIASLVYPVATWWGALEPIQSTALHVAAYVPWIYWLVGGVVASCGREPEPKSEGDAQVEAKSGERAPRVETKGSEPAQGQARAE